MTSTPIGWPLRFWFLVEVFFAASATSTVALRPAETATSFAWNIQPPVMASLFGAFYLALAPVVFLAMFARRWEAVRVFVLPGMLFTFTQLVVTFLHWERFLHGTLAFQIWFASYLLPPGVFLGCYLWQERRAGPRTFEAPLPRWARVALVVLGAALTLEALTGLVFPAWFSAWAPWKVTPLNARALSGYILLLGTMLLSMARENDRDRVRILSPFLILLLPAVAFQVRRFSGQVDWSHPRIAIVLALLLPVTLLGLTLARGSVASPPFPCRPIGARFSDVNPLTIELFHGADFDVNGTAGTDNATLEMANTFIQITDTTAGTAEYQAFNPTANAFLVRPFAATTDVFGVLGDTGITNFDNTGLPGTNFDFTGAFQWSLVIPASGSASVSVAMAGNTASTPVSLQSFSVE